MRCGKWNGVRDLIWADNQGSKKAIEEVFKVYNVHIEKALKEMKKDFKIVNLTL